MSEKATLLIERHLKDVNDLRPFDAEVEKIVEPFNASEKGRGTFLPTMTRDWAYEVDDGSADTLVTQLARAGYWVAIERARDDAADEM
jgi:hypothetical protein